MIDVYVNLSMLKLRLLLPCDGNRATNIMGIRIGPHERPKHRGGVANVETRQAVGRHCQCETNPLTKGRECQCGWTNN